MKSASEFAAKSAIMSEKLGTVASIGVGAFVLAMTVLTFSSRAQDLGSGQAKRKPASIAHKWKPLNTNGSGCNFGTVHGGSGTLVSLDGCPPSPKVALSFNVGNPAFVLNGTGYYFASNSEGERNQIGNIFCQQIGAHLNSVAPVPPEGVGVTDLSHFQYVGASLAPQSYNMSDTDLKVIGIISCRW